jgi:DNA-binding response OmpR family regulator
MAHGLFVHTDPEFIGEVIARLTEAGHTVSFQADPMNALDLLESDVTYDVLLSRIDFGEGTLNGIALARMKRTTIKVVFTGRTDFQNEAAGLGEYVSASINVSELVATVSSLGANRPVASTASSATGLQRA